jgi:hypothetical protein
MITLRRVVGTVCGLAVLSCILACGAFAKVKEAQQRVITSHDLKQIALAYISYCDANKGKTPPDFQTLLAWVQKKQPEAAGVVAQGGPGGKYTIRFGDWRFPTSFTAGTSNTIMAYETKAQSQGVIVVAMFDGSVRMMTPAEFAAAAPPPPSKKDK